MKPADEVLELEKEERYKHDVLAARMLQDTTRLIMFEEAWLRFQKPMPPSNSYFYCVKKLGDIRGKRILDFGCGTGELSVVLAKRGASVIGFDISFQSVLCSIARAKVNCVEDRCNFLVASAHALPLKKEMFDLIIGQAILHHVDLDIAREEIVQILKKGGRAIFHEAYADSKVLQTMRRLVPIKSVDDTESPRPQLSSTDIERFGGKFRHFSTQEFQILSRLDRIITSRRIMKVLHRLDDFLLRRVPPLRRYARLVVIEFYR